MQIAVLADLIRYLAIQKKGGGWILDCDTVWRSKAPPLDMAAPPGFGHFFSSMHASPGENGRTKEKIIRRWQVRYLREPQDKAWIATPAAFPPPSRALADLVAEGRAHALEASKTPEYNCLMNALARVARKFGLTGAIVHPDVASPILARHGDKCLRVAHASLLDEAKTLSRDVREQFLAVL